MQDECGKLSSLAFIGPDIAESKLEATISACAEIAPQTPF